MVQGKNGGEGGGGHMLFALLSGILNGGGGVVQGKSAESRPEYLFRLWQKTPRQGRWKVGAKIIPMFTGSPPEVSPAWGRLKILGLLKKRLVSL